MAADPPLASSRVDELAAVALRERRDELIELSRAAAEADRAPGFPREPPDAWLGWHWDDVAQRQERFDARVIVAFAAELMVGAGELCQVRAPGWGGWEPWKRFEIRSVIVHPEAPPDTEYELIAFMLQRSLVDFVSIEAPPGGPLQRAAERLGFEPAATIPDRSIGGDGSPQDAVLLVRSHAKPPMIRPELLDQVLAVPPSGAGDLLYRPCQVTLIDGRVLDRVYVQEAYTWKQRWGVWPEDDSGKDTISIEDVASISNSPSRLPAALATRLLEAGETGMGYTKFTLVLRGGRRINAFTGDAVDFAALPDGVSVAEIVEVVPHVHDGEPAARSLEPPYWWCLYTLPMD
jgi:hypothetical protein